MTDQAKGSLPEQSNSHQYRVGQVNTLRPYDCPNGLMYFTYRSLAEARRREKQVEGVPGVRCVVIERRAVGPWEVVEDTRS